MLDGYEGEEIKLGLVKCNCIYNSVIIFIMEDGVKRSLKVKFWSASVGIYYGRRSETKSEI